MHSMYVASACSMQTVMGVTGMGVTANTPDVMNESLGKYAELRADWRM